LKHDIPFLIRDHIKGHMPLCVDLQVLISILANGEKQRDMATMVEGNLGDIEQDLIQVGVSASFSCVIISALMKLQTELPHICASK
jgi:hypothetical protein